MKRLSNILMFFLLMGNADLVAAGESADLLSGRYGHEFSDPEFVPVWELTHVDDVWQAQTTVDGESTAAYRMSLTGRRAFWEKMGWTIASATEADCISWGQAAPSLIDFLNDDPPVASPNTFGHALICHVPSDVRASIGWLADQDEGWFYYDPVAGVMSIRRVP